MGDQAGGGAGEEVEILVELFDEPTAEEMWRGCRSRPTPDGAGSDRDPHSGPRRDPAGRPGDVGAGDAAYSPEENALCLFHEDGAVTDEVASPGTRSTASAGS